jgi:indole-3-glycerol phosphate synthase
VLGELVGLAERRAALVAPSFAGYSAPGDVGGRFRAALRRETVAVIAELKRRSPSKGVINASLPAGRRGAEYASGGAAALSVLTEPERFGGSIGDLVEVRAQVGIPLLRKDFIVHEAQIAEAHQAGADAVLLIARALNAARAMELAAYAFSLGLDVLYEVRDEAELERALAVPDCVIGVNTRNLETLAIDPDVGVRLLPQIPPDRVAVYESGVSSPADVERAAFAGADAVLVGSVLSPQPDGAAAVAALASVARQPRG